MDGGGSLGGSWVVRARFYLENRRTTSRPADGSRGGSDRFWGSRDHPLLETLNVFAQFVE